MDAERLDVPVLVGERVRLRPLQDADQAARVAIGRHAEFVRLNGGQADSADRPFTEADAERWFAARATSLRWAIEFEGQLIGEARLDRVDVTDRRASFAIGIYHRAGGIGAWAPRRPGSSSRTPSTRSSCTASNCAYSPSMSVRSRFIGNSDSSRKDASESRR